MSRFIKKANLPQGEVRALLIGERYRSLLEEPLSRLGADVLWMPDLAALPPETAGHADMAALYMGEGRLIASRELLAAMPSLDVCGLAIFDAANPLGAKYPADCGMNVCIVGGRAVLCRKAVDPAVMNHLGGLELIETAQGYARCSVCVVSESAIITADSGIARACRDSGLDVLEIQPGYIALDGYDYGFIGGASFKLSANTLAFTGSLCCHPDEGRIFDFLCRYDVTPVILTDEPIFDIGGAVLLTEK